MKSRIEELARELYKNSDGLPWRGKTVEAITTAVNEALELAAKECLDRVDPEWPNDDISMAHRVDAEAIRKLKL